jgi:hypothetical protein
MLSRIAKLSILTISLLVGGGLLHAAEVRESVDWQRSFLDQYCVACHNDVVREANFTLQSIALDQVGTHLEEVGTWEKVVLKLRAREMPPPGLPRPDAPVYDQLATWLARNITRRSRSSLTKSWSASNT